eukprot:jgi/Tetstr1/427563/TSEL_017689.t1
MATALKNLFGRRGSAAPSGPAGASEFSDSPETAPAWLKGGVYKPNKDVGKTLPIAWDGTSGTGVGGSATRGGGKGSAPAAGGGGGAGGRGGSNQLVPAADSRKLRSTLELPEGQVQIMVDPEAARIWSAIREVSEVLIEKALLCGEVELVAKFRQELAVLQIRNPGLLHSDALCNLLNGLSHVDLLALPRQRAVLALQKILLTMQELSQSSQYQYVPEGVDPATLRGLPPSSLPDLTIYIQDYKRVASEAQARAQAAVRRAEEAEAALRDSTMALPSSSHSASRPATKTLTPGQQKAQQKAIGELDEQMRRGEMQLSDLEEELKDKERRYSELIAKLEQTKQAIEEIDALLRTSSKESETKLRQLLQKQNAAALQLGMESVAAAGVGDLKSRRPSRGDDLQALVDGAGMMADEASFAARNMPSKMLGKMLKPDDPALVAYMAENRKTMEDAAARAVVAYVQKLLGLDGLVGEIEDSEEWKAVMAAEAAGGAVEEGADGAGKEGAARAGEDGAEDAVEGGDEEEEDEEDDDDDDDDDEDEDYDDDAVDQEMESVLGALDDLDMAEGNEGEVDPATGKTINRLLAGVLGEVEGSPVVVGGKKTKKSKGGRKGGDAAAAVPRASTPEGAKTVMDAETRIRKLLAFLQIRMEARGVAVGRLQTLWHKLQVPQEARDDVLAHWPGMGSEDLAGLHGELRRLEDKLAEARAKERALQGNALRNAIMMVDTLEPKWTEMEADRVKLKALKAIPGSSKEAERMLMEEAKVVARAEQRAIKKRKELFERFDGALQWLPNMKPDLLDRFKADHMSLAPTNLAELEVMIEYVELKARVPQATKQFQEKKRQLKVRCCLTNSGAGCGVRAGQE